MLEGLTGRDRHCTVEQLRSVLAELEDDDIICTLLPPTGNIPILRYGEQIGVIGLAPQDLSKPLAPKATLELFNEE